jgi:hypothetical protein
VPASSESWGVGSSLQNVVVALKRWGFDKFGVVNKELECIKQEIEDLSRRDVLSNQRKIDQLSCCMEELLYREEMMWLQRSRISWLREGDRNTSFFHRKAAAWGKKNRIDCLRTEEGLVVSDRKKMEDMVTCFFPKAIHSRPGHMP